MKKYASRQLISNKRVIIFTHQLGENLGGIIQAFALQKYFTDIGYDVVTSNFYRPSGIIRSSLGKIKRQLKMVMKKSNTLVFTKKDIEKTTKLTSQFVANNIKTVDLNNNSKKKYNSKDYEIVIVGSDQVWRAAHVDVSKYLLTTLYNDDNLLKISYAASFGKDDLSEYGPKLIKKSEKLAKKFDAISVREDTGVDICKKYWGVDAVQVVDPTLLLEVADYNKLIKDDSKLLKPSNGKIFTYILDKDSNKQRIIDHVANTRKQKVFDIMPPKPMSSKELKSNPEKYMLPHVTQWLKSFADADFVVTDSFHGCVFSIIYNKPFIAVGNKNRGLTRFTSLLKVFKLQNRLVANISDTDVALQSEIDWQKVNAIKAKEKKRAIEFLQTSISVSKNTKGQL